MPEETKDIDSIVKELDSIVPRPTGEVRLDVYGGGTDESRICATRDGYLRLGVELMKAASAERSEKSLQLPGVSLGDLLTEDSTIAFDWFERVESIAQPEPNSGLAARLAPPIIIAILLTIVVCTIIGAGTIVYWLMG